MAKLGGETAWHSASAAEALRALEADAERGLEDDEAGARLERHGPNAIAEQPGPGLLRMFLAQIRETLVLVLLGAAGVSFALGDLTDGFAILAIVALNTAIGVRQEYKAERAMEALAKLSAPHARVRREGRVVETSVDALVPGDIVILEAGAAVPADCRLIEAASLRLDESALTGESTPVDKDAAATLDAATALGDRTNMVYRGSAVAAGRGLGVVAATGMLTELGRIAGMLVELEDERTPLQRRLDRLGRFLTAAAAAIVAVVFAAGVLRGEDLDVMFFTAVSLAVAAVPEGLPAVVTIALALGAQRMLSRNALIRRLPAVEALGSVTVICTDKTGTLTENRMMLRTIVLPEGPVELDDQRARLALTAATLCNDAVLEKDRAVGDPTEVALAEAAARAGLPKPDLDELAPRLAEAPFESARKRMSTAHAVDELRGLPRAARYAVFAKGGLGAILQVATRVETAGGCEELDPARVAEIEARHDELAAAGMRVLALAWRPASDPPASGELERDLILIGLAGMLDPPRPEASDAVSKCRSAGIRTIMITGDHPKTAEAIADEIGIPHSGPAMSGREIAAASSAELEAAAAETGVYARVSPEDKLRIVAALRQRGQIVAMTGDGVNDAPALRRADIGVSMGITGSDVANEASDMVLRDDNFATIVAAVEEGRVIFDNVRKFIRYLLSANCGELWVMLAGPLTGMPIPLAPLQILWMNLITDGPPALALGVEPAERNVMARPPSAPQASVFGQGVGRDIVWIGLWMGTVALAVGWWYWRHGLEQWQTMVFTTLTFSQLALALAVRSSRESFFRQGPLSNPALSLAVVFSAGLQLAVVYFTPLQRVFETVALDGRDLGVAAGAGGLVFAAVEAEKLLRGTRRRG